LSGRNLKKIQLIIKDPEQKIKIESIHKDCEVKLYLDKAEYFNNIVFENILLCIK